MGSVSSCAPASRGTSIGVVRTGWVATAFVVLAGGCVAAVPDEEAVDEVGAVQQAIVFDAGNPKNPGTPDYCTPQFPCTEGGGDCDSDADCAPDHLCVDDVGANYGMPANYDVCVLDPCKNGVQDGDETGVDVGPSCNPNAPGDVDYCTPQFPCTEGGGDCDSDADCATGFVCADDVGADYGLPANYDVCVTDPCTNGVQDGDETSVDVGPSCNPNPPASVSYCSPQFPCFVGNGDCDGDADCAAGLICKDDVGADYGMPFNYDVCVQDPCQNGVQDGDETGIDVGPSCNPNAPGTVDYCTPQFPCVEGGGDCDGDWDCAPGFVCKDNAGADYGMPSNYDVCVQDSCQNGVQDGDETGIDVGPSCNPKAPGTADYCTLEFPCGERGGDCDSDADCATGLVCMEDVGADYGMPANYDVCVLDPCNNGVQDGDETGIDVGPSCNPNDPGTANYCSPEFPCGEGGGDCDSNADCLVRFSCVDDVGADYGLPANYDVCVPDGCYNGIQDGDETGVDVGPSCNPNDPGTKDYCTPEFPCENGEGDCDVDADCAVGLRCVSNLGADYGMPANYDVCVVPGPCNNGIQDGAETAIDYGGGCPNPYPPGHPNHCSVDYPCQSGNGDCDSDVECALGTLCVHDVGAAFNLPANYDICL